MTTTAGRKRSADTEAVSGRAKGGKESPPPPQAVWPAVGIRYSCDYCYKDISSIVRIQCAECGLSPTTPRLAGGSSSGTQEDSAQAEASAPAGSSGADEPLVKISAAITGGASGLLQEVDLCVECFAAGVEMGTHKRHHSYRVLSPLDFAIYRAEEEDSFWRADEELLLLEAIESNGLGNWQDIAAQVGSETRTAEECKEHYMAVYLGDGSNTKDGPAAPSRALLSVEEMAASRRYFAEGNYAERLCRRVKASSGGDAAGDGPAAGSGEDATAAGLQSVPANHEIAGYMELRGEFEVEIENDAEMVIKDMQFGEEDGLTDRQLKFTMLDIYTAVLERRASRHAFIEGHRLCEFKRHQAMDKARTKSERDIYTMLKAFARFLTAGDLQRLLEGMTGEEEIRRQIGLLQDYRRHGLRSFSQVAAFESERKHLELYLKGGAPIAPSQSAPIRALEVGREPHALPSVGGGGDRPFVPAFPYGRGAYEVVAARAAAAATSLPGEEDAAMQHARAQQAASGITAASAGGRKASTPLNISHAEGVDLLSEKERHLCSILRLYPQLYLSIKDTLIREYLRGNSVGLKRAQARAAVKIDVNKTSKLYDFFIAAGWIKAPASGE